MKKQPTNWQTHIESYHRSGLSMKEFCARKRINFGTFKVNYYKIKKRQQSSFKEYKVKSLTISITWESSNSVTLSGIDSKMLPNIIEACDNAFS